MKLKYKQMKDYLKDQCSNTDELDFFKIKAHLKGNTGMDYLIISFNDDYDAGFALIREDDGSNSFIGTISIRELVYEDASIIRNSQYINLYIDIQK